MLPRGHFFPEFLTVTVIKYSSCAKIKADDFLFKLFSANFKQLPIDALRSEKGKHEAEIENFKEETKRLKDEVNKLKKKRLVQNSKLLIKTEEIES
jgi:hypothetical protein